jgi:hypothetical protein
VYTLNKLRSSALNISIKAQDLGDDPDDMGNASIGFGGNSPTDFGKGSHTLENSNFKIYYTVTLTSPP